MLYSCSFYRCLPSTWRLRGAWNDSPNSGPVVFQFVSPTFVRLARRRKGTRTVSACKPSLLDEGIAGPTRRVSLARPCVVYSRFAKSSSRTSPFLSIRWAPGCEHWTGVESIVRDDRFTRSNIISRFADSRADKGRWGKINRAFVGICRSCLLLCEFISSRINFRFLLGKGFGIFYRYLIL